MQIVSWNLGQQCRDDAPVWGGFFHAIAALEPDLLFLNEYVHGSCAPLVTHGLSELAGMNAPVVSDRLNGHNQVLAAARQGIGRGELRGPVTDDRGGESNFLHVLLEGTNLELVGFRVPSYTGTKLRKYWEDMVATMRRCGNRRIVFIGDFNLDPESGKHGARLLRQLCAIGWSLPRCEGEWSYARADGYRSRIDHVIAAPAVRIIRARYATEYLDVSNPAPGTPDHAPLVVEIE